MLGFFACSSDNSKAENESAKQKVELIQKTQDTAKKAADKIEAETKKTAEEIEDLLKDI